MSFQDRRTVAQLTRVRAVRIHRRLGLLACVFWLTQAATGLISVFHWELEDASLSALWRPTNLPAIEARLAELAPAGSEKQVSTIWTTAGLPDRYDVWISDKKGLPTSVVRIAGDGTILRAKSPESRNFFDYAIELHQSLLAGKHGRWIIGFSGLLLISNILLGLRAAWPARGRWRAALVPRLSGSNHGRLYAWHRSIGLIFAFPALILFTAGASLAYKDGLSTMIGAHAPTMVPQLPLKGAKDIGFARAVEAAFVAAHTRHLTEVEMPTDKDSTYRIRVLAPGERRRAIGTTTVFVSASAGAIRATVPSASQPLPQRFMNTLYSIHTGEIVGLPGRLLVFAIGTWLLTMIILGLRLWTVRARASSRKKSEQNEATPSLGGPSRA